VTTSSSTFVNHVILEIPVVIIIKTIITRHAHNFVTRKEIYAWKYSQAEILETMQSPETRHATALLIAHQVHIPSAIIAGDGSESAHLIGRNQIPNMITELRSRTTCSARLQVQDEFIVAMSSQEHQLSQTAFTRCPRARQDVRENNKRKHILDFQVSKSRFGKQLDF